MEENDARSDFSFNSSSNSSSSKHAQIDEVTLKQGTDPVKRLIPLAFPVHFISLFLPQLAKIIEISLSIRFLGMEVVQDVIFLIPVYEIFNAVLAAISASAAIFIQRNIAKSQYVAATIYFSHYFLVAFFWWVVCIIVYFAVLARYFSTPQIGNYLLLRIVVGMFSGIFVRGMTPFLKAESKFFVILIRDSIESLLFIGLTSMLFSNPRSLEMNLTIPAVAFIMANLVCAIWMIWLIFKFPFLDVQYKGILRFQMKRLSPVRVKIIMQIITNAISPFLSVGTDSILLLEALFLVKTQLTSAEYRVIHYIQLLVFSRVQIIFQCFHLAFRDVFAQLASYNIGIKKVTRIYEILLWTVIFQASISLPIIAILAYPAKFLVNFIISVPVAERTPFYNFIISQSADAAFAGAWAMLLPAPFYLTISFLQVESKQLFAALLQLPFLLSTGLFLFLAIKTIAENAPMYLVLGMSQAVNLAIGLGLLVFYFMKYGKLHRLNLSKKDIADQAQQQATANEDVRQSVMLELAKTQEMEEQERSKQQRQSVTNLFNKSIALMGSKQFLNLRESIGGDTQPYIESSVRISQLNRESSVIQ